MYLGEDKVLDFLATMNFLDTADIPLLVFFFLDDSLHEPLFINRVKSLVDGAIVFEEDYQMEITENFFSLQGFGESAAAAKWYPCLDIKGYGIIPVDFLEVSELHEDKELRRRMEVAQARIILEYCKKEGILSVNEEKDYESLMKDEEKLSEWMEKKQSNFRMDKERKTFRTGIWAIDRIFSDRVNILGGIEQFYGIAIFYDIPPIDMHPVFAKILFQCFEDEKSFIEISIDDTPNVFLDSLELSHKMEMEYKRIKDELLKTEGARYKFINSYGIKPSEDLEESVNIINIDNPYNVTIMFAKYREARKSLRETLNPEENETGPVI